MYLLIQLHYKMTNFWRIGIKSLVMTATNPDTHKSGKSVHMLTKWVLLMAHAVAVRQDQGIWWIMGSVINCQGKHKWKEMKMNGRHFDLWHGAEKMTQSNDIPISQQQMQWPKPKHIWLSRNWMTHSFAMVHTWRFLYSQKCSPKYTE